MASISLGSEDTKGILIIKDAEAIRSLVCATVIINLSHRALFRLCISLVFNRHSVERLGCSNDLDIWNLPTYMYEWLHSLRFEG